MRLRRAGRKRESLTAWRDRLIAETELALLVGLRFPQRAPPIPTLKVGAGQFDPRFCLRFRAEALGVDEADLISPSDPEPGVENILNIAEPGN